jgi:hypothetical protein
VSVQVAWLLQSRLELSPVVTVQLDCAPHCVLHDAPHVPVQVAPPSQLNAQPFVCAVQAPVPLRLHCPAVVHEHVVPEQFAGAPAPPESEEPHAARSNTAEATQAKILFIRLSYRRGADFACDVQIRDG